MPLFIHRFVEKKRSYQIQTNTPENIRRGIFRYSTSLLTTGGATAARVAILRTGHYTRLPLRQVIWWIVHEE
jgi:hypothetical protein